MNISKKEFVEKMKEKLHHRKRLEELQGSVKKVKLPVVIIKEEDDIKFLKNEK